MPDRITMRKDVFLWLHGQQLKEFKGLRSSRNHPYEWPSKSLILLAEVSGWPCDAYKEDGGLDNEALTKD